MTVAEPLSPAGTAVTADKAAVLCVDDEPGVLDGLSLHLRRRYDVSTATSGVEALAWLDAHRTTAVIVSDMRMPLMDGATFLARSRTVVPDAVRLLLTGHADIDSAIAAINDGQIFRFLTKPCPPATLLAAVDAAAAQFRLVTAERVLLEQTLHGSIKALTDVLSLTSPVSFGRATRIKKLVGELAERLDTRNRWEVEVAAMLAHLGNIALPNDTVEKVYYGQPLTIDEQRMVAGVPAVTEQLLGSIPRLEGVRTILATYYQSAKPAGDPAQPPVRGAQMLRLAMEYDALEAKGDEPHVVLAALRKKAGRYDPAVFAALEALRGSDGTQNEIVEVPLSDVQVGMIFAQDVKLPTGVLLAARGYQVTAGFVTRAANFRHGLDRPTVSVILPKPSAT